MPTQQQVEFYRMKHQKFTTYKMQWSMFISLLSNIATAPLELLKVRAQLLQEGRKMHGWGWDRGVPTFRVFNEIIESGSGLKGFWVGYDSLLVRSFWYGGFRPYFWSLFYNYVNKDPRRTNHWAVTSIASFAGGFCAGVLTNPVDLIYNRQVAEELYPKGLRRNYSSFIDGLTKVHLEGALFRGAVASGFAYGMLNGSMSSFYDYSKELLYWIFGPTQWLRPLILLPTTYIGVCLYLPFDNIRVRFHTMTPLPNGELPYKGFFNTLNQVFNYEGNIKKYSSPVALLSGGIPAFWRLYISLFIGINLTDIAFNYNHLEGDIWEPADVFSGPRQGYIPHEPNYIDQYDADRFSPIKPRYKPEQNITLGSGTNSYIKY